MGMARSRGRCWSSGPARHGEPRAVDVGGCGYPDLLASGEVCEGHAIHDRQHPHDLFMEIAATYDRPIGGGVRAAIVWRSGRRTCARAVGISASHLGDAESRSRRSRITGSTRRTSPTASRQAASTARTGRPKRRVFNGREPDEDRDEPRLRRARFVVGPLLVSSDARWALQVSGGRLKEAEAGDDGGPRIDVNRLTATATYHHKSAAATIWASTVGWGRTRTRARATSAMVRRNEPDARIATSGSDASSWRRNRETISRSIALFPIFLWWPSCKVASHSTSRRGTVGPQGSARRCPQGSCRHR